MASDAVANSLSAGLKNQEEAWAQKMEIKLCVRTDRKSKRGKAYTRSKGLVKFRGTVGPHTVGKRV